MSAVHSAKSTTTSMPQWPHAPPPKYVTEYMVYVVFPQISGVIVLSYDNKLFKRIIVKCFLFSERKEETRTATRSGKGKIP